MIVSTQGNNFSNDCTETLLNSSREDRDSKERRIAAGWLRFNYRDITKWSIAGSVPEPEASRRKLVRSFRELEEDTAYPKWKKKRKNWEEEEEEEETRVQFFW